MKVNEHTALLTPRVLLVPYSAHHVPAYHAWMQDPAIRTATASEPLTLDEEYAMQRSWREDGDKLTFIVCVPPDQQAPPSIQGHGHDSPTRMIGDVNLFLVPDDEDEDGGGVVVGELEIMIASAAHQGRGLGAAVMCAFVVYIRQHLDDILSEYTASTGPKKETKTRLKHLRVKIGADNARSLRLFEKVGFVRMSETPNFTFFCDDF